MKIYSVIATIAITLTCVGCNAGPKSARGFSLPDGDAERGKSVFVALKCTSCHNVVGAQLPAPEDKAELNVVLGGEVTRIKTYGELVTSIINPSHRLAKGYPAQVVDVDGESKMTNYNDVLTVSQLIDLVAFLQSHYELKEFEPTDYPMYY